MGVDLSSHEPWDLVAEGYSEITMGVFQGYTDAALAMVNLDKQSRILDLACGPGTLALTAAKNVDNVKAADFSKEMIGILDRTLEREGINNIETWCGDGQALPYEDNSFDAAFSMFGLMFFPDRMKGYREIYRTLKPGGVAVISSWAPLSDSPLQQAVFGALREMMPNMPKPQQNMESLENPEVFREEMTRAGFKDVRIEAVSCGTEIASLERFWEDMVKGAAPLVMLKNSMTEEQWQEKTKIALDYLGKTIGDAKELTAQAWLGYGVKG